MTEPTFDHERIDVYRLSIDYVAFSNGIAKGLSGIQRPARDQWLRAAQSIPLNIAEGNGKQSLKDKNRSIEIARGSALECALIHDVLRVCDAIDEESNRKLKRIVSMLTRLIQRTQTVAENPFEYEYRDAEYEYRDAEYEYRDAEYEYRDAEYEYRDAEYEYRDAEYEYRDAEYEYEEQPENRNSQNHALRSRRA